MLIRLIFLYQVVIFVFSGRTSIVTPFIFYRFLGLRYSSRRNPYTRAIFHELR
jgi:transmembrane protein 33